MREITREWETEKMFNWDQITAKSLTEALVICEKFRTNAQDGIVTKAEMLLPAFLAHEIGLIQEKISDCISSDAEKNFATAKLLGAYPKTTVNNPAIFEEALGNAWECCPKNVFNIVLNRLWGKHSFPPMTADLTAVIQDVSSEITMLFSTVRLNEALKTKIENTQKALADERKMSDWKTTPEYKTAITAFSDILKSLGQKMKSNAV